MEPLTALLTRRDFARPRFVLCDANPASMNAEKEKACCCVITSCVAVRPKGFGCRNGARARPRALFGAMTTFASREKDGRIPSDGDNERAERKTPLRVLRPSIGLKWAAFADQPTDQVTIVRCNHVVHRRPIVLCRLTSLPGSTIFCPCCISVSGGLVPTWELGLDAKQV